MNYEKLTKEELIKQLRFKDRQLFLLKYDLKKQQDTISRIAGIMITVPISAVISYIILKFFNY